MAPKKEKEKNLILEKKFVELFSKLNEKDKTIHELTQKLGIFTENLF